MDWSAFTEIRAMPRLLSVAIMIGLSAWMVSLRPRDHALRGFALFLTSFALAVFCNTMGAFAAEAQKASWFGLTRHFEIIEIPALIYFVSFYPRPRGWFARSALMRLNLLLFVLALEVLVVLEPSLWFYSANNRTGLSVGVSGPINAFASKDNLAMALVAVLLARDYRFLQPGPRRNTLLLVWLGFAFSGLYDSTTATLWTARGWMDRVPLPDFFWNQVVYAFNLLALVGVFVAVGVMLRSMHIARGSYFDAEHKLLAYMLPWPVAAAVLETVFVPDKELFDSAFKLLVNGFIRITFAFTVSYALVRPYVVGLDLAIKQVLRHALVLGALGSVFFVIQLLAPAPGIGPTGALLLGTVAIAMAVVPLELVAGRLVDRLMPRIRREPEYLHGRRLEVYRAALEVALEDGVISSQERTELEVLGQQLSLERAELAHLERTTMPPVSIVRSEPTAH